MKTEISAGGIVYQKRGNEYYWLITKHSQNKNWSFPKGLVGDTNKDEPLEAAALREVEEEGGVKAKIIRKIETPSRYIYTFREQKIDKTVWYFLMEYVNGNPEDHDEEMDEAKFVTAKEALETLNYENDRRIFETLLKEIA